MFRIDSTGAAVAQPVLGAAGAVAGYFTEGDPGTGTLPTTVSADWLNTVQEEMLAVIEGAGLTASKTNAGQLLSAILALTGLSAAPATVSTTDATVTDLATVAVAENKSYIIEATVSAKNTDGSERYSAKVIGSFYRATGGNVTQDGSTSMIFENNTGDWGGIDLVADAVNQTVDLQVTGKAATNVVWNGRITIL